MPVITFVTVNGDLISESESVDWLDFNVVNSVGERTYGEYTYESEGNWGSSREAEGEFVLHGGHVFGFSTFHDVPSPESTIRRITDTTSIDVSLSSPQYSVESSQQFYRTYCGSGYDASFQKELGTYGYTSSSSVRVDPEEEAKERAIHSEERMSAKLVEEITNSLLDDGYYVAYMDVCLDEDGARAGFSAPLSFNVPDEEWTPELRDLIVDRALELVNDDVKTVDQVLDETN